MKIWVLVCYHIVRCVVTLVAMIQFHQFSKLGFFLSRKRFLNTSGLLSPNGRNNYHYGYLLNLGDSIALSAEDAAFKKLISSDNLNIPTDVIRHFERLYIYRKLAVKLIVNKYNQEFYRYLSGDAVDPMLDSVFKEKIRYVRTFDFNSIISNYKGGEGDFVHDDDGNIISIGKELSGYLTDNMVTPLKATKVKCKPHTVTVIICGYNAEQTISLALNSIIAQSHRQIEIIYYDDGSNDRSYELANQLLVNSGRSFQCIRGDRRMGVYKCRNKCLSIAKGRFVTFHDADDWAHPDKIYLQLLPLLRNSFLVCSSSDWVKYSPQLMRFTSRNTFPMQHWNCSSFMFKKSIMNAVGYYDEAPFGADSEYVARIEAVFTPFSHCKIRQNLTIGLTLNSSLTNAPQTGFDDYGWSRNRQLYTEEWLSWHARCFRDGILPSLDKGSRIPDLRA
jgi:hypothetical protein